MEQIYQFTIQILRYVLTGQFPEIDTNIDFEMLYMFSKSHGVENMVYAGLNALHVSMPEDTKNKFEQAYNFAIHMEAVQAFALDELTLEFEKEGIDNMPLKGSVIKYIYPMPDYRKSGDIDILIKPKDENIIKRVMEHLGYNVDLMDEYELHDGYRKAPGILVEIHDRLLEKGNRSYKFLSDIWEMVTLSKGSEHQYEMSKELFYTFSIAHFCKHIRNGGAGIKFVTDVYLMRERWGSLFDNYSLSQMIKKCRLNQFNDWVNQICDHWFNGVVPTDINVLELEKFILQGGCFGSEQQARAIKKSIAATNKAEEYKFKIKKTFNGIFVNYKSMRAYYPILTKWRILLPVMWVARMIKIISNKTLLDEKLKNAYDVDAEKTYKLSDLWKAVR